MKRRPLHPVPRWLRPRLAPDQVRDLSLVHHVNLDAIARGEADESVLWQVAGGVLTWSRVAERLGVHVEAMAQQAQLVTTLLQRHARTGRVLFSGPEYQVAKQGVMVMDDLAQRVDRVTAIEAAEWSERRIAQMTVEVRHADPA